MIEKEKSGKLVSDVATTTTNHTVLDGFGLVSER
jgi:hypothetical protein